jgi:hypothetical protein
MQDSLDEIAYIMYGPPIDCNDPIRSENWSPGWVLENRAPILMQPKEEPSASAEQKVGQGFGRGINL